MEALVLFTTPQIAGDKENCEAFELNEPGWAKGTLYSGSGFHRSFKPRLLDEVRPLARREKDKDGRLTNRLKPLELYWCLYDENEPVDTFERAAAVMRAAAGNVGKEFWVNLTGGRNIINSALQLAASLTGAPARMYYLHSANPRCIRHTVPLAKLNTADDRFWVDLPVVYLGDSEAHLRIMEAIEILGQGGPVMLSDLAKQMSGELRDEKTLIHGYLRPLAAQRLIVHEADAYGHHTYRPGEGWARERRYLEALRHDPDNPAPRSLSALAAAHPDWFRHERLSFD